jgi:hypothetical protein
LQLTEKLAGIGRQRFDITALTLGVERVEGERRFAGAADAGEADQLIARQFKMDVLQIVFASAAYDDVGGIHVDVV